MLGGCKTEKELMTKLERWRNIGSNRKLIHTVNSDYLKSSELSKKNAELVFNSWDVISCSLIDIKQLKKYSSELVDLASWENEMLETGLFFELGFVLEVPPQNILGAHASDVWFPNHAGKNGRSNRSKWALADAIFSGKGKPGGAHAWPEKTGGSYNKIRTPDDILRHTDMSKHNEILIIGKSDINTYSGFKPTNRIKVTAIIVAKKHRTGHALFSRAGDNEIQKTLHILRKVNPHLEVIEI